MVPMEKLTDEAAFERLLAPPPQGYGLTRAKIAEIVGTSRQNITRWKVVPTKHVPTLAKATGISKKKLLPSLFA